MIDLTWNRPLQILYDDIRRVCSILYSTSNLARITCVQNALLLVTINVFVVRNIHMRMTVCTLIGLPMYSCVCFGMIFECMYVCVFEYARLYKRAHSCMFVGIICSICVC